MTELLELDGDPTRTYYHDVAAWLRRLAGELAGEQTCRRIIDLESGPGVGTIALAQFFAEAEVVAVDMSGPMLERLRNEAINLGLADRVRTVQADLDEGLPDVGVVDLVWASTSLQHLKEPEPILQRLAATMSSGALVAVAFAQQMGSPPRPLPHSIDPCRPAVEDRRQALTERHYHQWLEHSDNDWESRLERCGFALEAERIFTSGLRPPLPPNGDRCIGRSNQWARQGADLFPDTDYRVVIDALPSRLRPEPAQPRHGLTICTSTKVWVARRDFF